MSRSSIIRILVCMCVLSITAWAEPTVYKWTDYAKPFKTRLVRIRDTDIAIVKVDLPKSIVENKEVILMVSSSFNSGSATGCMLLISVNEKELGYRSCGPDARVVFDRSIINAGTNTLKFSGSKYTNAEIYDLRIELRDTVAQTSPPPASKSIDTITTVKLEPPKIPQPPAIVEPLVSKQKETSQTGKKEITLEKEKVAPVGRTDIGQRWAVVIGVSEYEDSRIPGLRYAARDAQSVYDWLVSPKGGRFAPSRVNLLLNRNAANDNIKGHSSLG